MADLSKNIEILTDKISSKLFIKQSCNNSKLIVSSLLGNVTAKLQLRFKLDKFQKKKKKNSVSRKMCLKVCVLKFTHAYTSGTFFFTIPPMD